MRPRRHVPLRVLPVAALAAILAFAVPAGAQVVGDFGLDSRTRSPSNAVQVGLGSGWYSLGVVAGAWNPWGNVSGCDGSGANCTNGWQTRFNWSVAGMSGSGGDGALWATSALATANTSDPFLISLGAPSTLELYISDCCYSDNQGTVTVRVAEAAPPPTSTVPEPGTVALLGTGLLGLAGIARWRRRDSEVAAGFDEA